MNRVLIVRLSSLGDIVLTRPVLSSLKARWPDSYLSLLVKPEYAPLVKSWPEVDEVLVFHGLRSALREIRRRRFSHLLDLHANFRSFFIRLFSGIRRVSAYRKDILARRLFVAFGWKSSRLERSTSQRYLEALGAWNIPPVFPKRTPEHAKNENLIGIHAGAAWATKRWPAERFVEICRRLRKQGLRPVLVGGEKDEKISAQIAEESGAENLAGKLALTELNSFVERCSLFIANDSGPMHLAAAAGVPVIAIFGSTTRELGFFPQGPGHRVIESELACRPCRLHGADHCPEGHFLCMRLVTTDQVWKACQESCALGTSA